MTEYIIFIILNYAITNILCYGGIFQGMRDWFDKYITFIGDLFACMMCMGMWIGMILSFLYFQPVIVTHFNEYVNYGLNIFLGGAFGSGTTWLIHTMQEFIERSNRPTGWGENNDEG